MSFPTLCESCHMVVTYAKYQHGGGGPFYLVNFIKFEEEKIALNLFC